MMTGLLVHHETFPAMGSEIEIVLVGNRRDAGARAAQFARWLAADWEAIFSRFRPDSELRLLNNRAGQPAIVSAMLYSAVVSAMYAAGQTAGLFNPMVLPNLVDLGYDRPFRELTETGHGREQPLAIPSIDRIQLDPETRTITLPTGSALDLGGIAKGLFVDLLVNELSDFPGGIISAGGDLRVWGKPPGSDNWSIGLEHPCRPGEDLLDITLGNGAVATSGTNRRFWNRGMMVVHHLIDPQTGMPATTPAQSISVVAQTAEVADVLATALFIQQAETASEVDLFSPLFAVAIIVANDGSVRVIDGGLTLDVSIDEAVGRQSFG